MAARRTSEHPAGWSEIHIIRSMGLRDLARARKSAIYSLDMTASHAPSSVSDKLANTITVMEYEGIIGFA